MKLLTASIATLALCGLIFTACKKDPLPVPADTAPHIRFDALAVGQTSRYLGLTGETAQDIFVYTDDTLVLQVISQNGSGFLVSESLHYKGDVHPWYELRKDEEFRFYIKVEGDSIHFIPSSTSYLQSRIIGYQTGRIGLPSTPYINQSVAINGWKTSFPFCSCLNTGYAENYTLFGTQYPLLNVLVDNSPMSYDVNGETYIYAAESGTVRFSTYGGWTSGVGWDLLPAE